MQVGDKYFIKIIFIYRYCNSLPLQFNYRYSGAAELHVFVVEVLYERNGTQILAYKGAQYAVARAMQYAQLMYVAHYGIVNEVAHGLYSLLTPVKRIHSCKTIKRFEKLPTIQW